MPNFMELPAWHSLVLGIFDMVGSGDFMSILCTPCFHTSDRVCPTGCKTSCSWNWFSPAPLLPHFLPRERISAGCQCHRACKTCRTSKTCWGTQGPLKMPGKGAEMDGLVISHFPVLTRKDYWVTLRIQLIFSKKESLDSTVGHGESLGLQRVQFLGKASKVFRDFKARTDWIG